MTPGQEYQEYKEHRRAAIKAVGKAVGNALGATLFAVEHDLLY
jgi:hypothetical protein